jgi:hypothetical protein
VCTVAARCFCPRSVWPHGEGCQSGRGAPEGVEGQGQEAQQGVPRAGQAGSGRQAGRRPAGRRDLGPHREGSALSTDSPRLTTGPETAGSLSKDEKSQLSKLRTEFDRIKKAKAEQAAQEQPKASTSAPVDDTSKYYTKDGKVKNPKRSFYYDPVFNPCQSLVACVPLCLETLQMEYRHLACLTRSVVRAVCSQRNSLNCRGSTFPGTAGRSRIRGCFVRR